MTSEKFEDILVSKIRLHYAAIMLFFFGYFFGAIVQCFALKNDYEATIRFLKKLGYTGVVCTKQ
jgi:hypothetical protein